MAKLNGIYDTHVIYTEDGYLRFDYRLTKVMYTTDVNKAVSWGRAVDAITVAERFNGIVLRTTDMKLYNKVTHQFV